MSQAWTIYLYPRVARAFVMQRRLGRCSLVMQAEPSDVMNSLTHLVAQLFSGMCVRCFKVRQKYLHSVSSPFSSSLFETAPLSLLGHVWQAALHFRFCPLWFALRNDNPGWIKHEFEKHIEEMWMAVWLGVWHKETTFSGLFIYDSSYLKLLLPSGLHKWLFFFSVSIPWHRWT